MAATAQFIQFGPILNAGVLETGIKVYHYVAGTTTDKDMWIDRDKTSTVAQPLVGDANGIASAWGDGLYKFVIKDSDDTTLYTYDEVQVLDPQAAVDGEGAALTAASTLTLGNDGDFFHVTGATGITAISGSQSQVLLVFDAAPTLTHSASLILLGSVNVTVAAGDWMRFVNEGAGVWREIGRGASGSLQLTGAVTQSGVLTYSATSLIGKLLGGFPCDFRLSLVSGSPVPTADQTAKTILYMTPYKGTRIALYNTGTSKWTLYNSSEMNLTPTLAASKPYDVFCYDNSGTPTLEVLVWTDDTNRATALTTQDGVYVKTGDASRRYIGTIYSNASSQMTDSDAFRHVWNYYNRVARPMRNAAEGTDSWTYSTATWREANGATDNRLDYVCGVSEDAVDVTVRGSAGHSSSSIAAGVGIGVDSTTTDSAHEKQTGSNMTNFLQTFLAHYNGFPGVGRHFLVWLERAVATGTHTWRGDNGDVYAQTGIHGTIWG